MKKIIIVFLFSLFATINAQQDSTKSPNEFVGYGQPTGLRTSAKANKIYYGGGIGMSYSSNYISVSLRPMFGYKLTPKLSVGLEIMYEYVKDTRYRTTYNYSNYGGSLFARFRVVPQLYFHAEYATYNYEYRTAYNGGEREWIPFLLLGAGYVQRMGRNTYAYAQVLWDVLQDDRSPYDSSQPWVTFGVSTGF